MKTSLSFQEFSAANRERCEAPDGFDHALDAWSASDWLTATVGELGEAANVIKKLNRIRDGIRGNKENEYELRAKLKKELGDVGVYLDLMCQAHGWTMEECMVEVFNSKSIEIGYSTLEL
jgi:NTP pyrophosphatase (non-canonical NTP hydrolase)